MSKKKLYPESSINKKYKNISDIMNFLTYSDGKNDLESISKFIKIDYKKTNKIYNFLLKKKIIS